MSRISGSFSVIFLSTPSARRATQYQRYHKYHRSISIHALREEGDSTMGYCNLETKYFYPRPPRGGRLQWRRKVHTVRRFLSTPSARRATTHICGIFSDNAYFYPRPPRGGRQQKQRENTLLLSHYTPPCTNCKEVSVKQAVKLHRCLHSRPLFQCEASRKTMCTVCSHWPDIKRSARCPVQTPGVVQRVRPWSGSCCPVGRTADCLRRG